MPHALHVIDATSPAVHGCVMAHLADLAQPVLVVGDRALRDTAEAMGVASPAHLPLSATTPPIMAAPRLRRALEQLGRPTDLHAWSLRGVALLRRAALPTARLTLHLIQSPPADDLARLRRRWGVDHRNLFLHCFDQATRQQLIAAGFHQDQVLTQPAPQADASRRMPRGAERDAARAMLRERWGVDEATRVIVPLSDPAYALYTPTVMMAVNLAAMASGSAMRLLVHPQQAGRERSQAVLDQLGLADRLIQEPQLELPWQVLPGCDVVMCTSAPAPLAAPHARASGLPIVAPDFAHHREAFADSDRVHFAPSDDPKKLADRLQHHALGLAGVRMAASY